MLLEAVIRRHQPIAVMHFAAFAYVGESVADPATYYRNNVIGSLTLLEAMRAAGVGRIVFSSSCTTYGVRGAEPIGEDTPQAPVNPYGVTKAAGRTGAARPTPPPTTCARGRHALFQRRRRGSRRARSAEAHGSGNPPDPAGAGSRRDLGAPLTVFGDDYPTPDGTCIRDYIHVSDLADAHVAACRSMEQTPGFRAYNLGTGRGLSNLEIIAAARRLTGCEIPIRMGPRRAGDPPMLTADASKAGRELGWTPRLKFRGRHHRDRAGAGVSAATRPRHLAGAAS